MQLRRSVFITFFSTNAATAIQFGVTLILSRLLTPSEVGIYSITVVFTGIIAVFRDFGVTSYLQREKELSPEKIRAALGLLLTTSWSLAAFIFYTSSYVADYYRQPGIQDVLHILTLSFALVPFASFFYALLARNLEAGKQAIVNGVSTFAYAISCITLAYLDYSYLALAWANVVNILVTIVCYLFLRPKDVPYIPSFSGWGEPAKFGGGAILGNLIERLYGAVPDLVLGKLSGAHDVGLYSRANGLVGIFSQIAGPTINYNAVPYIAKNFHNKEPLAPILSKATSYLTVFSWPFFIVTALFPKEMILVLYGEQWVAAAPIAVFICIQAIIRTGYSLTMPSLMAIGRPYLASLSAGFGLIVRLLAIYVMGAHDAYTFAIALCIADILAIALPIWLMSTQLEYGFSMAIKAHWLSLKVNSAVFVSAVGVKLLLPANTIAPLVLLIASAAIITTWIYFLVFFKHSLCDELPAIVNRLLPPAIASRIIKFIHTPSRHA
ncbi:MAG: oligosaccharide flippase family protein [Anaerolineae bacterium]|nr:oligosaccharide flippase family protein [Anaerolineae bacterium]